MNKIKAGYPDIALQTPYRILTDFPLAGPSLSEKEMRMSSISLAASLWFSLHSTLCHRLIQKLHSAHAVPVEQLLIFNISLLILEVCTGASYYIAYRRALHYVLKIYVLPKVCRRGHHLRVVCAKPCRCK